MHICSYAVPEDKSYKLRKSSALLYYLYIGQRFSNVFIFYDKEACVREGVFETFVVLHETSVVLHDPAVQWERVIWVYP